MTFTRWSRWRARRALRRGLSKFEARLDSSVPGIAFTARITATVHTEPPYPQSTDEIAAAIRSVLRKAASDISPKCEPADLTSAQDTIARHLASRRSLSTNPPVEFHARLVLDLFPDDRAAVTALLTAQRRQAVADRLRRQKTDAMAQELADPAAVLVRWLEQQADTWSDLPDAEKLSNIAAAFAEHRTDRERTIEYATLEVIRDFLDSFQDPPQRRMVYEVLAAGMRHAKRPDHADRTEALLNTHPSTNERPSDT
ncbi:hypothetical protein ACIBI4_13920 [Streptomyces sp. NPDC050418]|uniref:hypothetical protein n=1 Tax=Streptomyces sp. NPDC050418 TaxID=3365612 RepID=UPI0037A4C0A1